MTASKIDAVETKLERQLRALGMHRETAMTEAERHTDRLTAEDDGVFVRLVDGSVVRGWAGIAALAREIAAYSRISVGSDG